MENLLSIDNFIKYLIIYLSVKAQSSVFIGMLSFTYLEVIVLAGFFCVRSITEDSDIEISPLYHITNQ